MSREKEFLNELRFNGEIKGTNPFIILLKKTSNMRKLRATKYIVTFKDNIVYFYSMSLFTSKLSHKDDFTLSISDIKQFIFMAINEKTKSLTFFDKKERQLIFYLGLSRDTIHSNFNFGNFIDYLRQKGVNEVE